jgi:hypothetical protein
LIGDPAPVQLPDGEPSFGPWQVRSIDDVLRDVGVPGLPGSAPLLMAVDGRSGDLAAFLHALVWVQADRGVA